MCTEVCEPLLKHELSSVLLLSCARMPRPYLHPQSSYVYHPWGSWAHSQVWPYTTVARFPGPEPASDWIDRSVTGKVILGGTHNDSLKMVLLFETQPKQPHISPKGGIKKYAHLSVCETVLSL